MSKSTAVDNSKGGCDRFVGTALVASAAVPLSAPREMRRRPSCT